MPSALAAYRNLLTAGGAVSKIVSLPVSKIVSLPCHADGISLMQNVFVTRRSCPDRHSRTRDRRTRGGAGALLQRGR